MSLIQKYSFLIPKRIRKFIRTSYENYLIRSIESKQVKSLKTVKQKSKIKVAFFVIHDSVWKYDTLYKLLNDDVRFEPIIVICPHLTDSFEQSLKTMHQANNTFIKKGYNVVMTFNENSRTWLNVKETIKPDIIFFTNPHKITRKEYLITNYPNTLTCYVQYSFHITHLHELQYNQLFHNLLWSSFCETSTHLKFAEKHARNKASNVVVTGYPGLDEMLDEGRIKQNQWKLKDPDIKNIIWAPHHSISENDTLAYSCFLQYSDFMLNLLERYKNKIQISFKPHPMLRQNLVNKDGWGKRKTDDYYNTWANATNGQLDEGGYIDLFLTSDAMIFDSASFMTEYIFTEKPSLFTVHDEQLVTRFNEFGKEVFQKHYHGNNENDIISFIDNVVLLGDDKKKNERSEFRMDYMSQQKNNSASLNIYNYLISNIILNNK